MNKKHLFFAALFFAALTLGFVGCENPDDESGTLMENPDEFDEFICNKLTLNVTDGGSVYLSQPYYGKVRNQTFELYNKEEVIEITAYADKGYYFVGWSDCNSKKSSRNINVKSDTTITAFFAEIPLLENIRPNNADFGRIKTTFISDSVYTIEAEANDLYYLSGWSDCDSKEQSRTIKVSPDTTITAIFSKRACLSVDCMLSNGRIYNPFMPDVFGDGTSKYIKDGDFHDYYNYYFIPGSKATIRARMNTRYYFVGWSDCDNAENIIEKRDGGYHVYREVEINSDTTIMSIVGLMEICSYTKCEDCAGNIRVTNLGYPNGEIMGRQENESTRESASFWPGEIASITAVPNECGYFKSWSFTYDRNLTQTIVVNEDTEKISATWCYKYSVFVKEYYEGLCENRTLIGYFMPGETVTTTAPPSSRLGFELVSNTSSTITLPSQEVYEATGKTITFTYTAIDKPMKTDERNGHGYVDLGLPSGLKWATCNVGAYSGNYDKEKDIVDYINRSYDFQEETTVWGSYFYIPTYADFRELIDNCYVINCTNYNNTKLGGNIFISKKNGNHIFLPASTYWTSTKIGNMGDYFSTTEKNMLSSGIGTQRSLRLVCR